MHHSIWFSRLSKSPLVILIQFSQLLSIDLSSKLSHISFAALYVCLSYGCSFRLDDILFTMPERRRVLSDLGRQWSNQPGLTELAGHVPGTHQPWHHNGRYIRQRHPKVASLRSPGGSDLSGVSQRCLVSPDCSAGAACGGRYHTWTHAHRIMSRSACGHQGKARGSDMEPTDLVWVLLRGGGARSGEDGGEEVV